MAGPIAVVLASLASAWVAARSDDGVVAQDYYKQGLLINQKLRRASPATAPVAGAEIAVAGGRAHVQLIDAEAVPQRMEIRLMRPGERTHSLRIELARAGDEWIGTLPELAPGRWIMSLESDRWELPTTVVDAPFTELQLGSKHR